jgi:hypothetical protein
LTGFTGLTGSKANLISPPAALETQSTLREELAHGDAGISKPEIRQAWFRLIYFPIFALLRNAFPLLGKKSEPRPSTEDNEYWDTSPEYGINDIPRGRRKWESTKKHLSHPLTPLARGAENTEKENLAQSRGQTRDQSLSRLRS